MAYAILMQRCVLNFVGTIDQSIVFTRLDRIEFIALPRITDNTTTRQHIIQIIYISIHHHESPRR